MSNSNGSVNEVRIIGRLGTNPEMRYTPGGSAVTTLFVYTNRSWTDGNGEQRTESERHKVVCWGKKAEACNQYLQKGARVEVAGSIHYPSWNDPETGEKRYGVEIRASRVLFLDRPQAPMESEEQAEPQGQDAEPQPAAAPEQAAKPQRKRKSKAAVEVEDLPF
jgi:single-strand DNA-binding protein